MKKQTQAEQKLDALLSESPVSAPDDFSNRVVRRIALQTKHIASPGTANLNKPETTATPLWQWFALGTASLAGAFQMIGFVFGIWAATAAG